MIDYSLILGIHCRNIDGKDDDAKTEDDVDQWDENQLFEYDHGGMSFAEPEDEDDVVEKADTLEISWSDNKMETLDEAKNRIYFMGIIDFLQPYNTRKRAESFIKGLQTDKDKISSVDPETYAKRFVTFMEGAIH